MPSVYARQKNEQGKWRYSRVNVGPGPSPADLTGPFFVRVIYNGKTSWLPAGDSLEEARGAVKEQKAMQDAEKAGLVLEEAEATNRLVTKITAYIAETE